MIVWYENQPLEKGLLFKINKYYPNCSIKGYKSISSIIIFIFILDQQIIIFK